MKLKILAISAAALLPAAMAQADCGIQVQLAGYNYLQIANADLESLTFDDANAIFKATDGTTFPVCIDDIANVAPVTEIASQLTICFDGTTATYTNPYLLKGVSVEVDGANVTVTNPNEAEELSFTLTGASPDASFTYNGTYKCTLTLDNLQITSLSGAAVNVNCSKRIAVNVKGDNTLEDCAEGSQKACFYVKGHPEFSGNGTLTVKGNTKHAISTKEYMQLKKTFGTINVVGAESDGIHAGQYFQMNGGTVSVRNVKGDGIQAEATSEPDDEQNGEMLIKGGTIDVEISGDDCDCLKSDSLMTVSGGYITVKSTGATSKGLKSKDKMLISGGEINALMTGDGIITPEETTTSAASAPVLRGPGGWPGGGGGGWPGGADQEDTETSAPGCIKADGALAITGGTLNLRATGKGGKCINCEDYAIIGEEGTDGPTIIASTTGGPVTGSGENISGQPKAIKVYGDLTINSGTITATTTGNGGEGIECKSYLTINGGLISCLTYDDAINAGKKITVNGGMILANASNNDGMDCNGSEGFEFNGGIILASGTTSPEEGFDCDNYRFAINGGTIIGTGGASSNVTVATQPFSMLSNKSVTAGTYLSLVRPDGSVICSYKMHKTLSAKVVVSSPEFVSGTSYKLTVNSTAVNNPDASYFDGRFTIGGTLTGGTSSSFSPSTK